MDRPPNVVDFRRRDSKLEQGNAGACASSNAQSSSTTSWSKSSPFIPENKRGRKLTWYKGFRNCGLDRFGLPSELLHQNKESAPTNLIFARLPLSTQTIRRRPQHRDADFLIKSGEWKCTCFEVETEIEDYEQEDVFVPRVTRHGGVWRQLLCGGFAGVVSRTAVAPLDLVKTHLITAHGMHGYHRSAHDIFMEIYNKEGWRGLFRGNGVNCVRVAPSKAIELCVFETVKKLLSKAGPFQRFAAPLAGGAAGTAGTLATYPLELVRTRLSLQPDKYPGAIAAITKVIDEEGFSALFAGIWPSVFGVFPYSATNYCVYDGLRSAYRRATGKKQVPTSYTLLFGALAAAASSAVTYPLEVARRQMQLGSAALHAQNSALDVVRDIYAREGFMALYRGLGTTWLKLVPAAAISFVCYEAARKAFELDECHLEAPKKKSKKW